MTTKETRGSPLTRDDYQGSKVWSALADWTIMSYIKREGKEIVPLEGHVRFGKVGMLSTWENFDYKINNKKWQDDNIEHHTVSIDWKLPEKEVNYDKAMTELHKNKILRTIADSTSILSGDLRIKLGVGRSSEITPSMFRRRIDSMRDDGVINSFRNTSKTYYSLTERGFSILGHGCTYTTSDSTNVSNTIPTDDAFLKDTMLKQINILLCLAEEI